MEFTVLSAVRLARGGGRCDQIEQSLGKTMIWRAAMRIALFVVPFRVFFLFLISD